jgi:hypothetical protein
MSIFKKTIKRKARPAKAEPRHSQHYQYFDAAQ